MKNQNFEINDKTFSELLTSFVPEDPKITKRRELIRKILTALFWISIFLGIITLHIKILSDSMFSVSFILFLIWFYKK